MQIETSLIVLGLGSNLGDSKRIILEAVKALEEILTDLRYASLYETEPLYVTDQGRFINTAAAGYFADSPEKLLQHVNKIESNFGRDRTHEKRWGERTLDIDILLFGDLLVAEQDLIIPHPRLKERRFALEPLLELLPDAVEPGTGQSYRSINEALPDQGVRRLTKTAINSRLFFTLNLR